jgi:siroheme decarboxylase
MTDVQVTLIRSVQDGIPISQEPFEEIADQTGITETELLEQLCAWKADGTIRRFGAVLRHHQAGYNVNSMGVWNVPDEQAESFGKMAAMSKSVSHCYQRPRFGGFPYNLYTMIHGKSREECEAVARSIAEATNISDYELLYSTKEFKKSSPVYFTDETTELTERSS